VVREVSGRIREQDLTVSVRTVAEVFERLAGPDGLTGQASTFARQDVIAALGGQLAGATRAELEELADRFLVEWAVAVVAERALEERRWSTPERLATEQRLVAAATGRAGRADRCGVLCGGPGRPAGPPECRCGPTGNDPRPLPGRRRGRPGGGAGRGRGGGSGRCRAV
jgi:hypothetical protein